MPVELGVALEVVVAVMLELAEAEEDAVGVADVEGEFDGLADAELDPDGLLDDEAVGL